MMGAEPLLCTGLYGVAVFSERGMVADRWGGAARKLSVPCLSVFLGLLLLAVPLSAQDRTTTLVPPIEITVQPTPFVNNITVMSDSTMLANLNANLVALREQIAERGCNACGGANRTTKVAVTVLLPVLVWIALELRGIKNNSAGTPGEPGQDGADGADGKDGEDGEDHDDDHEYGESG